MANHNNEGINGSPDSTKDAGLDKSIVGKLVSGLISNTPLSKWFNKDSSSSASSSNSLIRRRADLDEDEEQSFSIQPPVKRAKIPLNCYFETQEPEQSYTNNVNSTNKPFGGFPEPQAGPSGVKFKLFSTKHTGDSHFINQDVVNGDDESDSGESTSGYSSVPRPASKKTEVDHQKSREEAKPCKNRSLFVSGNDSNQTRSLFSERSLSPHLNASLSSRRPAFNASTFGSPNFVDRTLSTKRIMSSPFYSGHTIYGGASAYPRRFAKSLEESQSRNSIQIKPVVKKSSSDENPTLSKTARRILSTLEQYSTPISDAKKIPVTPKREGILSKYIGAAPYSMKDRKRGASNTELQVPSIPDLLQMKQKERLQNSTESVRQIANSSKSSLNKQESYKLRVDDVSSTQPKRSNKMKSNISSVRQKLQQKQQEETVPEVNLPKVSLPITSLPKFDFVMAPPQSQPSTSPKPAKTHTVTSTNVVTKTKTITFKETEIKEDEKVSDYKFSEPLVISENQKSISAINCFKFSEPLSKNVTNDKSKKPKNNGEKVEIVTLQPLSSFISKDKWECQTCLVRNDPDKSKCVACDEPKPKAEENSLVPVQTESLLPPLKAANTDEWTCKICWIKNKNEASNCAACQALKNASVPAACFVDQFKPPSDTWSCPTCMINNKNDALKCVACETAKPGSVPAPVSSSKSFNFGIKPEEWQCKTCWVNNKADAKSCCACETPKDEDSSKSKSVKSFGDAFKMKDTEWECTSCLVRNKSNATVCVCCGVAKIGAQVEADKIKDPEKKSVISFNFGIDKAGPQFKFGIPADQKEKSSETSNIIFGSTTTNTTTPAATFSFGVAPPQANKIETSTSNVNPLLKPSEKLPEKAEPAATGFSFGLSNNLSDKSGDKLKSSGSNNNITKPMFEFKPVSMNGDVNNKELHTTSGNVSTTNTITTTSTSLFNTATISSSSNTIIAPITPTASFKFEAKPLSTVAPVLTQTTSASTLFKFGGSTEQQKKRSLEESVETGVNGFGNAPKVASFPTASNVNMPFSFNASNATTEPPPSKIATFNFDAKPNSSAPVFNFGAPNTNANANPNPVQSTGGASSGFNFSVTTVPSTGFNFGNKSETPPFGGFGAKNGTFNFGPNPNNNNQKAVFTFGANQSQASAGSNSQGAGFAFGAASTGGVVAPAPAAAPVAGGFNFAGTPPSFTLSAEGGSAAGQSQRKFRKALRRTHR